MKNNVQKATLLVSIMASIAASACCIGPIIFALLGVSSAGIFTRLEAYRPFIGGVTLVLLGAAYYVVYKKKPAVECATGSYCAKPQSDVWNRRILWTATLLILGFLTFPYWSIILV